MSSSKVPPWALVIGLAFLVRLTYVAAVFLTSGQEGFLLEDSRGLIATAQKLAAGQTMLGFDGGAAFDGSVMPLTVLVLAVTLFATSSVALFLLIQAFVDAATCFFIGRIAETFHPSLFLPAGLLAAVNPTQVVVAGTILTDTFFFFFSTGALLALLGLITRKDTEKVFTQAGLLGLFLGLAVLTRSAIAIWIPVAATILLLCLIRRAGWVKSIAASVLPLLIVCVCLAPVLVRNYNHYGSPSVTPQGAHHLLFWVIPLISNYTGVGSFDAVQADAAEKLENRLEGQPQPVTLTVERKVTMTLAKEYLAELGPVRIGMAWTYGAAMNLALPAAAVMPPVRSIPRESFYAAGGDGLADKVFSYLSNPSNALFVAVLGGGTIVAIVWLIALPFGILALSGTKPLGVGLLILWGIYILGINGPVASPKYRLPLESTLVVFCAAGLMRNRIDGIAPLKETS